MTTTIMIRNSVFHSSIHSGIIVFLLEFIVMRAAFFLRRKYQTCSPEIAIDMWVRAGGLFEKSSLLVLLAKEHLTLP